MHALRIRIGTSRDIDPALEVERAADSRFGPGLLPSDDVTAADSFEAARFFVAERDGRIIGFALAAEHNTAMHLEQLSVHPDEGRRGVGSALLQSVIDDARALGCDSITLTTFRSVVWNAPFYARRGFVEPVPLPVPLAEMLAGEERMGFDPADRVALVLVLTRSDD
ncbi:GNAT family N-acetyltransferase [Microbacteriaceae bacterium VKM Ac-2854]|nr:GNAT family N-acetyltransferase [Microbacteriaceae bacterium VKM Ac-2854]